MQTTLVWLMLFAALTGPAAARAAVQNDEVTSAKIKEATPGSTSQDTNTGNGVKTGHLTDAAVTAPKIADGAVTDAKISGKISSGKLPVGTSATSVAAGNHTHDALYSRKYANVVVVAKAGGDFANPADAVRSIGDASPENPYLVKVMPGVYDLGGGFVQMQPYVDLEGSGDASVIRTARGGLEAQNCDYGAVVMASNSTLRNVMVVNAVPEGHTSATAIAFIDVVAKAEGVTAVTGRDTLAGGFPNAVCTEGPAADVVLDRVVLETRNTAGHSEPIMFRGGKLLVTNSRLTARNVNGSIDVINENNWGEAGDVAVVDTILEGKCSGCNATGIWAGDNRISVSNSTVTLEIGPGATARAFDTRGPLTLVNTQFFTDGVLGYDASAEIAPIKIVGSRLPGGTTTTFTGDVRLLNNYDEELNPIPNR